MKKQQLTPFGCEVKIFIIAESYVGNRTSQSLRASRFVDFSSIPWCRLTIFFGPDWRIPDRCLNRAWLLVITASFWMEFLAYLSWLFTRKVAGWICGQKT